MSNLALSSHNNVTKFVVSKECVGRRLDQFLGGLSDDFPQTSRSAFKGLIGREFVLVNGSTQKAGYRIRLHDAIEVTIPAPVPLEIVPEEIEFPILYEDTDILVLSKPPGLVVHPACGNYSGTLVHGLLHHCQDLSGINGTVRPGIVHRLDKFTSGVMVVAKNDIAHNSLVQQFKDKKVEKTYLALLDGCPDMSRGRIVSLIGRHPVNRKKMAVLERNGKEAITNWRVKTSYGRFTLVEILLETGRTHQIRVHMAATRIPVAGDEVYGRKNAGYKDMGIVRQFLHSFQISFVHPTSNEKCTFTAPLWPDMAAVLQQLDDEADACG